MLKSTTQMILVLQKKTFKTNKKNIQMVCNEDRMHRLHTSFLLSTKSNAAETKR